MVAGRVIGATTGAVVGVTVGAVTGVAEAIAAVAAAVVVVWSVVSARTTPTIVAPTLSPVATTFEATAVRRVARCGAISDVRRVVRSSDTPR